jgi:hypothetical protein
MAKDGKIDIVVGKDLSVLGHAEFFEPVRNLLHAAHHRSRRGMTELSTTPWL